MIVFDLSCPDGHHFEGWFGSSQDYESQFARGLLCCPQCGSSTIGKAPMAPAVPKKGNQRVVKNKPAEFTRAATGSSAVGRALASGKPPPEFLKAMETLASMQTEALKNSEWVGDKFADESRAIHYGEKAAKPIHGQATISQAKQLEEEGIAVSPLPFPIAPPDDIN
jgi:hypothetical protein